jgi:hypothetical protein
MMAPSALDDAVPSSEAKNCVLMIDDRWPEPTITATSLQQFVFSRPDR